MAWFDWLAGIFTGPRTTGAPLPIEPVGINPATGLPMTGGIGGVSGNPYGRDFSHAHKNHTWSAYNDHTHHLTHDHRDNWSNPAGGYDPSRDW